MIGVGGAEREVPSGKVISMTRFPTGSETVGVLSDSASEVASFFSSFCTGAASLAAGFGFLEGEPFLLTDDGSVGDTPGIISI